MRAIARKYADKTLANPGLVFVLMLFGTGIIVLLGLAFGVGLHAVYSLWRSDGLILYAITIILSVYAVRTILSGLKELSLFWHQLWASKQPHVGKVQGTLAFGLDFFVTEVFRAGGFVAFAFATHRAVHAGVTIDPLFFVGAGALLVGTYVQAIVSAAYLRWKVTSEAYRNTLILDATIQEFGLIEPTLRLMRSVMRRNGVFTVASFLVVIYKALDLAMYFIVPVLLQNMIFTKDSSSLVGLTLDYTFTLAAFWMTALTFAGAVVMVSRVIIKEYRAWTTYSKRLILAGTALICAVIGDGVLRITSLYGAYASQDIQVALSALPFVIGADIIVVLLMLIFSRILIEDW